MRDTPTDFREQYEPIACAQCGARMNHHADKVLYFNETNVGGSTLATAGEFIEEFHACPNCGAEASRPAVS